MDGKWECLLYRIYPTTILLCLIYVFIFHTHTQSYSSFSLGKIFLLFTAVFFFFFYFTISSSINCRMLYYTAVSSSSHFFPLIFCNFFLYSRCGSEKNFSVYFFTALWYPDEKSPCLNDIFLFLLLIQQHRLLQTVYDREKWKRN